jgi:hypothetical protein
MTEVQWTVRIDNHFVENLCSADSKSFLQLTNKEHWENGELADPAPPFVTNQGEIEIYGTGDYFLRYSSWFEFLAGGKFKKFSVEFNKWHAWDLRKYRILNSGVFEKEIFLLGGIRHGREHVRRRIYLMMDDALHPISCITPETLGMKGHCYGGNFFQAGQKDPNTIDIARSFYFFYDEVTDVFGDHPVVTEIMRVKMKSLTEAAEVPHAIIGASLKLYPLMKRTIGGGGSLAEGPRPFEFRDVRTGRSIFIIGFSTGDFMTDSYTMAFAWSEKIDGEFIILENPDGDLKDFGSLFKEAHSLSGFGRPVLFYTPDAHVEFLAHGYAKMLFPSHDFKRWSPKFTEFRRFLFKGKVDIEFSPHSGLSIALK